MERQPAAPGKGLSQLAASLRSPVYALPAVVVVVTLTAAVVWQPGGSPASGGGVQLAAKPAEDALLPSPTPEPTATAATTTVTGATTPLSSAVEAETATAEVAAARATATPTSRPRVFANVGDCGELREAAFSLAVEQGLYGVTVAARGAAVYPLDYLQCVLAGMEGAEAEALADALAERYRAGDTHAVVLDLWVTNGARTFAQVNLRRATVAAAGQSFAPVAVIGGRGELVLGSGEGRTVTLLVTVRNTVGDTTGPLTLVVDAPLLSGQPVAGRYQLFLPLP